MKDPHDFYKRVIAPYKGELEMWYQENRSYFRFTINFYDSLGNIFPKSKLYEKWFKDLPNEVFNKYKLCHSIQIQQRKQEKNPKEDLQKKKDLPLKKRWNAL